jgi:hypothetical protein
MRQAQETAERGEEAQRVGVGLLDRVPQHRGTVGRAPACLGPGGGQGGLAGAGRGRDPQQGLRRRPVQQVEQGGALHQPRGRRGAGRVRVAGVVLPTQCPHLGSPATAGRPAIQAAADDGKILAIRQSVMHP